jgi:hypothetical protein
MLNYDLSPFYRSTVGFDRLLTMLDKSVGAEQNVPAYPPYNIEKTGENAYRTVEARRPEKPAESTTGIIPGDRGKDGGSWCRPPLQASNRRTGKITSSSGRCHDRTAT